MNPEAWRSWPRALLAGLVLATVAALVLAGATSGAAFGAYNPAWEGTSELRAQVGATTEEPLLRDAGGYADLEAEGTLAIVLSPETAYGEDAAAVRGFVRRGGTLLVAEDFGPHANPLLASVGADARVDGRPVLDSRNYHRQPALPVAEPVAEHPLVVGVDSLTLNRPTALRPGEATVLVSTSAYAYVDADDDGALDDEEPLSARPVASVEPVGEGRVIVVADPSAFINRMLERPGNRAFLTNLLGAHDRAVLDVSHAGSLPPLPAAVLAVRDSAPLQLLAGGLALLLVGLLADGLPVGRWRREPTPDGPLLSAAAVESLLEREHPEWDPARIERITTRLGRDRQGGRR